MPFVGAMSTHGEGESAAAQSSPHEAHGGNAQGLPSYETSRVYRLHGRPRGGGARVGIFAQILRGKPGLGPRQDAGGRG